MARPALPAACGNRFGHFGGSRFDNDIQYSGTFNGFTVRAEHALGEVAGSSSDNAATALGLSYANGPFAVGAAYTAKKANVAIAPAPASYQDNSQFTAGGAYRTSAFRFTAGLLSDKQKTGTAVATTKSDTMWGGVTYFISPDLWLTGAHYFTKYKLGGDDGKKNMTMVALQKPLSKRTSLYLEVDHSTFSGVAIGTISPEGQSKQTGISVGMFHQF